MPRIWPRRTLADWTPEAGDQAAWLARWVSAGWRVESGPGECVVNGVTLQRWAMVEADWPPG